MSDEIKIPEGTHWEPAHSSLDANVQAEWAHYGNLYFWRGEDGHLRVLIHDAPGFDRDEFMRQFEESLKDSP